MIKSREKARGARNRTINDDQGRDMQGDNAMISMGMGNLTSITLVIRRKGREIWITTVIALVIWPVIISSDHFPPMMASKLMKKHHPSYHAHKHMSGRRFAAILKLKPCLLSFYSLCYARNGFFRSYHALYQDRDSFPLHPMCVSLLFFHVFPILNVCICK